MHGNHTAPGGTRLRVRVNVTCAGTLIALNEASAIVELSQPQSPDRQTTLAIEAAEGDTIYIPARVVRTEPNARSTASRPAHYVFMEFLEPSRQTAAAIRTLAGGAETIVQGRTA
jgi:hypothetical protein